MARRDIRSKALLATARITGLRWSVAMRDAEWEGFLTLVDQDAQLRLAAVMKRFCDRGDRDLPAGAFGWLSSPGEAAHEAAFEARGVVLRGHATDKVCFVTSIDVDPAVPPPRPRRGRPVPAGGQLNLALLTPTETSHGRDR